MVRWNSVCCTHQSSLLQTSNKERIRIMSDHVLVLSPIWQLPLRHSPIESHAFLDPRIKVPLLGGSSIALLEEDALTYHPGGRKAKLWKHSSSDRTLRGNQSTDSRCTRQASVTFNDVGLDTMGGSGNVRKSKRRTYGPGTGGGGRADGGPRAMYPPVGGPEMINNSGKGGTWVDLRTTIRIQVRHARNYAGCDE